MGPAVPQDGDRWLDSRTSREAGRVREPPRAAGLPAQPTPSSELDGGRWPVRVPTRERDIPQLGDLEDGFTAGLLVRVWAG